VTIAAVVQFVVVVGSQLESLQVKLSFDVTRRLQLLLLLLSDPETLTGSDLAVEVVFESRSDKVDSSPWTRAHITRATMERFVDDNIVRTA